MKIGILTSCVIALAVSAMLFPCAASAQQIYKWVDEQGNVHYGNDPYKAPKDAKKVETKGRGFVQEEYVVEEAKPAGETKKNGDQAQAAPKNGAAGQGVEVVGGVVEFLNTDAGLTLVKATLKNNFDYPVEGLRLDVILWFQDTTRSEVVSIPYLGGKPKGKLDTKATGAVEYELNYNPADISGYEYQVVWAYFEKAPKPTEGESAEGVFHKVIPGKAKAPASAETKPAETKPKAQAPEPSKEEAYTPKTRRAARTEERRKQAAETNKSKQQGQESGSPSQ